jgi:hypothetical protein
MEWLVECVRRDGVVFGRHGRMHERGQLVVEETFDSEVKRTVRTARLVDAANKDLLPPLRDVTLVAASRDWMTLTGYEVKETALGAGQAFQQSWVLEDPAFYDAENARVQEQQQRRQAGEAVDQPWVGKARSRRRR